jgi:hypothetical protein
MMEFVNESRLAVAAMGAGIMRRVFLEAAIRATRRHAFGKPILAHGMVRETLVSLLVDSEAAAALLFRMAARLPATLDAIGAGDPLARILVPLTKIRCTRGGIESASAALEIFGGNGYIEDWPMARQLRDAQCHTIWEGTENVLALDVLRTMAKDDSHVAVLGLCDDILAGADDPLLAPVRDLIAGGRARLAENLARVAGAGAEVARLRARQLAADMTDVVCAALLLDQAGWELGERQSARKAVVAAWYARARLGPRGRWHTGDERVALTLCEPLIRYEPITRAQAAGAL